MSGLHRRALIDLARLRANALSLTADATPGVCSGHTPPHAPSDFWADLRADAYGHGRAEIETALRELGVSVFEPSAGRRCLPAESLYAGVMRLSAEVVAVKNVEAGRGVSYGYTYRTPDPTQLALVGLGFADGVPRVASNTACVFVGGARAPIVGRIAMDQFMANVGEQTVNVGDEVVLFGAGDTDGSGGAENTAESTEGVTWEPAESTAAKQLAQELTTADWARATGIPALALTAGLGARIKRIYFDTANSPPEQTTTAGRATATATPPRLPAGDRAPEAEQ